MMRLPLKPGSPQPRSSAIIRMMFGRSAAAAPAPRRGSKVQPNADPMNSLRCMCLLVSTPNSLSDGFHDVEAFRIEERMVVRHILRDDQVDAHGCTRGSHLS